MWLATRRKPRELESHFLKLPPELRRHIYSFALPYTIKSIKANAPPGQHPTVLWIRSSTALLRICHLIHDECADLLYSTNTFVIDITFHSLKFHMTWLTTKGLRPKILYDFPHVFARCNVERIRNYAVTVEHVDSYQGMIKYNCGGPMLTAGIRERVSHFVNAAGHAPELGSLFVRLADGNPVLKDIRSVTAYRVERGKDVAKMQEVLRPLGMLYANFVDTCGAVTPEYAAQLKKIIMQKQKQSHDVVAGTAPNIEPAVLWRWQMNWNA